MQDRIRLYLEKTFGEKMRYIDIVWGILYGCAQSRSEKCPVTSLKVILLITLVAAFLTLSTIPQADSQSNVSSADLPANLAGIDISDAIRYGILEQGSTAETLNDSVLMPYFELIGNNDRTSRFYTKCILNRLAVLPLPYIEPAPAPEAQLVPKYPVEILWDSPYMESIKPIQNYDRNYLRSCDASYKFGAGPLLVDPQETYSGYTYAYPGDTIGMKLRLFNNGKPIDTTARVEISLSKKTNEQWTDNLVKLHYNMGLQAEEKAAFYRNITINVPADRNETGFFRVYVKFFVNDTLSSEMSKEFNVL